MNGYDDTELLPAIGQNGDGPEETPQADPSLLGMLKARRAAVQNRHSVDFAVPGWGEHFGLRLGPISGAQQARLF